MMAIAVELVDKVPSVTHARHGSWINTDRFPKRTPRAKASNGFGGHAPAGKFFRFLTSLKSITFLGF